MRGIIVPFPQWDDISWIECKKQLESYAETSITLVSGIQLEGPMTLNGCPMYLTLARCKEYDFTLKHNSAFDDEDGDF
jgi:hypothetical protein